MHALATLYQLSPQLWGQRIRLGFERWARLHTKTAQVERGPSERYNNSFRGVSCCNHGLVLRNVWTKLVRAQHSMCNKYGRSTTQVWEIRYVQQQATWKIYRAGKRLRDAEVTSVLSTARRGEWLGGRRNLYFVAPNWLLHSVH